MRHINSHALYLDLLQDLGLSYGDDFIIEPWDNPSTAARKSLAKSFLKKFSDDIDQDACDKAALDKFLSVNSRCGTWQLKCETLQDVKLIEALKRHLVSFFHVDYAMPLVHSFSSILDDARCGPGSSVGSESTDFYTKLFDSKLSCTSAGLCRAYANYIKIYPLWSEAEETRRSSWGDSDIVEGNRLCFVPKDASISRSICVEPSLNMFFQLGLGRIIERRLKFYFGVDLSFQPDINRLLARSGSVDGDMVTIDLASASDSMSLLMVRELFPPDFVQWLEILRSKKSRYKNEWIELNMLSTMGNGFTFPLQTVLFSCVVAAAHELDAKQRVDHPHGARRAISEFLPNWSVFGDDIICSQRVLGKVLRLLKLIGFEVNSNKTFFEGLFRESCGHDYFRGHDVRGVYCKSLSTPQDCYSLINLLNKWSSWQGITLPCTARRLLRSVPQIVVPPWENADCGVWIPERVLYLYKHKLRVSKNGSLLYKRHVPKQAFMRVEDEKIHVPRRSKPRRYNPAGLYLAFLNGSITNGKILTRPGKVRYVTKWAVAPNWSHHPTVRDPFKGPFGGPALERPELINIISAW
jgi:hypothetical protein